MRKCYAPSVYNRQPLLLPGCFAIICNAIAGVLHQFFISLHHIGFLQKRKPVFVQANAGFVFISHCNNFKSA